MLLSPADVSAHLLGSLTPAASLIHFTSYHKEMRCIRSCMVYKVPLSSFAASLL